MHPKHVSLLSHEGGPHTCGVHPTHVGFTPCDREEIYTICIVFFHPI